MHRYARPGNLGLISSNTAHPDITASMAKYDGIKNQELLDVEEKKNEITLIFKDNRYLFVKIQNGQLVIDSVPE